MSQDLEGTFFIWLASLVQPECLEQQKDEQCSLLSTVSQSQGKTLHRSLHKRKRADNCEFNHSQYKNAMTCVTHTKHVLMRQKI